MDSTTTIDISIPVFRSYAFFSSLLIFKMLAMSFLMIQLRFRFKVVEEPEDMTQMSSRLFKFKLKVGKRKHIERLKRSHLNDMENILPFLAMGILYCFTHPSPGTANFLFKIFTIARYLHTVVHVIYIIEQPIRAIVWSIAMIVNLHMTFKIFFYFW